MGKLFKWSFILFNIIMVIWLISYWKHIGDLSAQNSDSASQTGVAIGATLGTGMLFGRGLLAISSSGFSPFSHEQSLEPENCRP